LKDITQSELKKRDSKKPETEEEKLERICENRRRRWDCFHLATAEYLGCEAFYTTDENLFKRPRQLELKTIKAQSPELPLASIRGPLLRNVNDDAV
jgi:hypothetical protein